MHFEAFIILIGLFLTVASLVKMRDESAAGRRVRRSSRRAVSTKSRRKMVGATGR